MVCAGVTRNPGLSLIIASTVRCFPPWLGSFQACNRAKQHGMWYQQLCSESLDKYGMERQLLIGFYFDGESLKQLAAQRGTSLGSIQVRKKRVLLRLRKVFEGLTQ
jgi:hypothetical protein